VLTHGTADLTGSVLPPDACPVAWCWATRPFTKLRGPC